MRLSCLLLIGLCLLFFPKNLFGQTDAQLSQYWEMPTFYNPGSVARNDNLTVAAINRMQWVGVDNAPNTFAITADTPFKFLRKRHGLGVTVINDKAGLFASTYFTLQYSYRVRLWNGDLNLGLGLGAVDQKFDGSGVFIPSSPDHNPSDQYIPTQSVSAMGFDASFGAWYTHKKFYMGLSTTHLTQPTLELDESSIMQLKRTFYFTAGCNINFRNTLYVLHPTMLLKSDFQATQLDLGARLAYNKVVWGGLSYRWKDAVIVSLGAEFKGVRFGYSYDIGTSALARVSDGSHEIFASYSVKLNIGPKPRNRYKSIRIL